MTFPARSLLALALAAAATPALAASPYSGTVFFGDSLTDSGHYRPALPESVRPVIGKFTTNPGYVWAEYVAQYYGGNGASDNAGGDDYAQGGSRAAVQNGDAESTLSQVGRYLDANGGRADRNALYTVWTGANDIFAIAAGAPVQTTLAGAVTGTIGAVGQLQAAGARYILVPTLPDMGLTPSARAAGPAGMAALTQLASSYNGALFAGLAANGYRVIPVDTFHLLQEVVAAPATYGFRNATDPGCLDSSSLTCSPASYVAPDAASAYVFADGVHPSAATHAILAQYALSILEAPRLQQVLARSATNLGRERSLQVAGHVDPAGLGQDGLRWWGGVRGDSQRYDHGDMYDGVAPAALFGLDWNRGAWVVGGFAGYERLKADFGQSRGNFRQTDTSVGAFAGWYGAQAWVNLQASYSWLGYDVRRQVDLGPARRLHTGSPDGHDLTAALSGGWEWSAGALRHGPLAALTWQKVAIDGYTESGGGSTALGYGDQDATSLTGRVGWAVRMEGERVSPYLQASWEHEFKRPQQASAWLQSMPEVGEYQVPGLAYGRSYGALALGARTRLGGLHSDIGVATTVGQSGAHDTSLFVTFGNAF